eukprot:scaffold37464_cov160-Amphora_coffeaeformis.AAC.1
MHLIQPSASLQNILMSAPSSIMTMTGGAAAASPQQSLLWENLWNSPHIVGGAWVVSSALFTTYSTTKYLKYQAPAVTTNKNKKEQPSLLLSKLSRPTLLTLCRFGGSLLLGLVAHPDWRIVDRCLATLAAARHFAWPALFLYVANYMNSISLDRIGISLTYTSKCGIPLMTVLLTVLLSGMHELPNALALASLIPIAVGIACASWNSPSFEPVGFMAAMTSTLAQSALNVSSKRAISKTGIRGPEAQRAMVAVGLVLAVFSTAIQTWRSSSFHDTTTINGDVSSSNAARAVQQQQPPGWLGAAAVLAYHIEYVLSFMFVRLVQPITYGTCDAMRRLSIILTGQVMFGGPGFTHINIFGIALSLLGALSYSIASNMK